MRRAMALVAGLVVLTGTSIHGNSGVFLTGGDVGHVHHIGGVARTARIVVDIAAKQAGIDFTCPMKITLVFLADNNRTALQRRTFRRNQLNSRVVLPSAPISGEAVLFLQNQNINHVCNLTFSATQEGTVPLALSSQESGESEVGGVEEDVPPDVAVPVNPVAARQSGLP